MAATPDPPPTVKKYKNYFICSEFDFEHPHDQIGAKRITGELETTSKARQYRQKQNPQPLPMSPFSFPVLYDFSTAVIITLFSTSRRSHRT